MKGVVLLAVIHILIMYQSRKNKPALQKDIPAHTVSVPQVVKSTVPKPDAKPAKPGYAVFMLPSSAIFQARALNN